jgi:hypothetical protein
VGLRLRQVALGRKNILFSAWRKAENLYFLPVIALGKKIIF